MGESGAAGGTFRLNPRAADLRHDVLRKSFDNCRLQQRFAEKVGRLQMELVVAPGVPQRAFIDAGRRGGFSCRSIAACCCVSRRCVLRLLRRGWARAGRD